MRVVYDRRFVPVAVLRDVLEEHLFRVTVSDRAFQAHPLPGSARPVEFDHAQQAIESGFHAERLIVRQTEDYRLKLAVLCQGFGHRGNARRVRFERPAVLAPVEQHVLRIRALGIPALHVSVY